MMRFMTTSLRSNKNYIFADNFDNLSLRQIKNKQKMANTLDSIADALKKLDEKLDTSVTDLKQQISQNSELLAPLTTNVSNLQTTVTQNKDTADAQHDAVKTALKQLSDTVSPLQTEVQVLQDTTHTSTSRQYKQY